MVGLFRSHSNISESLPPEASKLSCREKIVIDMMSKSERCTDQHLQLWCSKSSVCKALYLEFVEVKSADSAHVLLKVQQMRV